MFENIFVFGEYIYDVLINRVLLYLSSRLYTDVLYMIELSPKCDVCIQS